MELGSCADEMSWDPVMSGVPCGGGSGIEEMVTCFVMSLITGPLSSLILA